MAYQQWITTEEEDLYLLYHQAAQRALYEGSPAYESKLLSKSKKFDHHNAHTTTEFGRVQPVSNRRERPQPFNTLARRNFRARGIRGYTSAYHDFVNQNNKKLLTKIEATITSHVDELDEASAIIQAEFRNQKFSTTLRMRLQCDCPSWIHRSIWLFDRLPHAKICQMHLLQGSMILTSIFHTLK